MSPSTPPYPPIISCRGFRPELGADCFVAPNATIIGDVVLGDGCSLWFNSVVRGDVNRIRIGHETNVQDGAIIHCTYQTAATTIGNRVSIGHGAIVHGCTLQDDVLIGMGAKLLDHSHVEPFVLVAAGALIPPGVRLTSGYLYAGVPAKQRRPLTEAERELIVRTAKNYQLYASWYTDAGSSSAI